MNKPKRKPFDGLKVLIIGKVWPESRSSAAGSRMMQLIDLLMRHHFEVHFASAASKSQHTDDLTPLGVVCHTIRLNDSSFDRFIRKLSPAVVIFDRFMTEEQFGWRVADQCPDAIRILDTEDLHSLRATRQKAWKSGTTFHPEQMYAEEVTKREIASICRSDLSLIISKAEMELLIHHFPVENSQLFYLPYLLNPIEKEAIHRWPDFHEREGFVSIGNFLHEPNRNAVRFLKETIWPSIRSQLPKAELHVYGAYPAQQDLELNAPEEGFFVKGRAENSQAVISKSRVLLAPLRFGAGLKGKLIDAMVTGTPSVTTPIGSEGISTPDDWCGFVEDAHDKFAQKAVHLYQDQKRWERAREAGFNIVNEHFLKENHEPGFMDMLERIMSNVELHRKSLFTGSMLMHHTLASNRYMGKWIEEKESRSTD